MIPPMETLTVEFKSDRKKLSDSDIFDAIVAFANTDGGDIYLGVEHNGKVTGVHDEHKNTITLGAYIANNTVPPISVKVIPIEESDNKLVIKISVPKLCSGIAATASGKVMRRLIKLDGTPENIPMYPLEMTTRLSSLRLLDFSAMPVNGASVKDFDPLETERLRKTILSYEGDRLLLELQDEDLFKALGFAREVAGQLLPTITGLLMIGRKSKIEEHIPTHSASFQVLEGSSVKVNEDMVLPLLATFERLSDLINARNSENEIDIGMYRLSAPDFDKRAIREAIVNSFSHRDYTKLGRVRVIITDEGLTISNPGGFIEGVTVNNLLTVEPQGRNPLLSDALKRVGLAERTGRGIDRIYEGSLIYGKQMPDYSYSTAISVSLLISRGAADTQFTSVIANEQKRIGRPLPINTLLVLNILRDAPGSDINKLSKTANLSTTTVKTILGDAIESGLVETRGNGRGLNYVLAHKVYNNNSNNGYAAGRERQKNIDEARYPELILNLASSQEYISRRDVVNLLNISSPKAYGALKKLSKSGRLEPVNKGRYAKYRINN